MTNATITRTTLVDALTKEVGLSKNECAELLEDFLKTMTDCLAEGATIKVTNFGSFSVHHKGSRMGRNPRTGEEAPILARRVVRFRPAKKFKHRINNPERPHKGQIKLAAQELVERHGDSALAVAKERVEYLEQSSGEQRNIDFAMLVLTEVERLVKRI